MGLFFPEDRHNAPESDYGFAGYRLLLEDNWNHYLKCGLILTLSLIPFFLAIVFSLLSQSLLVALLGGGITGILVGPAFYGLYDCILTSLRHQHTNWRTRYFQVLKKNWKSSLLPSGILYGFISIFIFIIMIFWWKNSLPNLADSIVLLISFGIVFGINLIYWPQLVLFQQTNVTRIKNCLLFYLKYPLRCLLALGIQALYWGILALLLPWSVVIVPLTIWFPVFLSTFVLYPSLNSAFQIDTLFEST